MKIEDYYRYNKSVLWHSVKVTGIVFSTLIVLFIAIAIDFKYTLAETITIFATSVLLGNIIAASLCFLKLYALYVKAKRNFDLFDNLSDYIKERYNLIIVYDNNSFKKNRFLEVQLAGHTNESSIFIEKYDTKEVFITIGNKFDDSFNFTKRKIEIDKIYKKQNISLSGWGLRKTIHPSNWKSITDLEFDAIIAEILQISEYEGIELLKDENKL